MTDPALDVRTVVSGLVTPTSMVFIGPNDTERRIRKITSPTMIVYPAAKSNGTGIVIVPGGGLNYVTIDKEGTAAAMGEHAWRHRPEAEAPRDVLHLRRWSEDRGRRCGAGGAAGQAPGSGGASTQPRTGILGFSSGGDLTLAAATSARVESRTAFSVAIYASAPDDVRGPSGRSAAVSGAGSRRRCGVRDATLRVYTAWHKARIPAELHIFWKAATVLVRKRSEPPS
jgi:dienelactone hydrolase